MGAGEGEAVGTKLDLPSSSGLLGTAAAASGALDDVSAGGLLRRVQRYMRKATPQTSTANTAAPTAMPAIAPLEREEAEELPSPPLLPFPPVAPEGPVGSLPTTTVEVFLLPSAAVLVWVVAEPD